MRKIKKKSKIIISIIILSSLASAILIFVIFNYSQTHFTVDKWNNTHVHERYKLVKSFTNDYDLVNMTSSEVEDLLGVPDRIWNRESEDEFSYWYLIKKDNYKGLQWLDISFADDKVKSYYIRRGSV